MGKLTAVAAGPTALCVSNVTVHGRTWAWARQIDPDATEHWDKRVRIHFGAKTHMPQSLSDLARFKTRYLSNLVAKITEVVVRSTPSRRPMSSIRSLRLLPPSVSRIAIMSYSPLIAWIAWT